MKRLISSMLCLGMLVGCTSSPQASASSFTPETKEYACRMINYYDYSQPVPKTTEPIDNAYFQDTFFGGDSRMGSLYLFTDLRDKGAEVYYAESLSLFRIYDMKMEGSDKPLYDLLKETTRNNIYILLGVNEIRSPDFESWGEEYDALIQELKEKNPKVNIYIMGSYRPRSVSGLNTDQLTEQLDKLNSKMKELALKNHVFYLDTNSGITDESGLVKENLVWDDLHLNTEGSQLFADQIARHVVQEETYVKKVCE